MMGSITTRQVAQRPLSQGLLHPPEQRFGAITTFWSHDFQRANQQQVKGKNRGYLRKLYAVLLGPLKRFNHIGYATRLHEDTGRIDVDTWLLNKDQNKSSQLAIATGLNALDLALGTLFRDHDVSFIQRDKNDRILDQTEQE